MTNGAVELVETDVPAALAPFDEQTAFDVTSGTRTLYALRALRGTQAGTVVGSAVLGQGALDLHLEPEFRAQGLGGEAAGRLLARAGSGPLTAWSHEDHPAARALAARFGFDAARTLLRLRLALDHFETHSAHSSDDPVGRRAPDAERAALARANITTFRPGTDDAEWLALNARVFALHAEQGRIAQHDLDDRMREPWFRADDFLIARDEHGRMIGYNWLKVESPQRSAAAYTARAAGSRGGDARTMSTGEIYVIGVEPGNAGHGLGRALMTAGLARLRARGCAEATLFVEGDNERGIRLYRSLGFTDAEVHVQYARQDA